MNRLNGELRGWSLVWDIWGAFPFYMPSLALIAFGGTLLLPGSTFSTSPGFAGMASLMSEDAWGVLLLSIGVLHLVATVIVPVVARQFLMLVWLPYAFIATTMWLSSPLPSTGVGIYGLVALLVLWSYSKWGARWRG